MGIPKPAMKHEITANMFQYAIELSALNWSEMTSSQRRHAEYFEAEIAGMNWNRSK